MRGRAGRGRGRPGRRRGAEAELGEQHAPTRTGIVEGGPDDPRRRLHEHAALDAADSDRPVVAGTSKPTSGSGRTAMAQTPIGCQTVFISRKAAIHRVARRRGRRASRSGLRTPSSDGGGRRLMSSAASSSVVEAHGVGDAPRVDRVDVLVARRGPARARALRPVRTLTTPPGTSEVASTSLRVTAGSGRVSDVSRTDRVAAHERRREPATRAPAATTSRARRRRRRRSARGS